MKRSLKMSDVRTEISKEEYLEYKANPSAYNRERRGKIPVNWFRGYGWYGCECYESHGHYYCVDKVGDSCD